METKKSAVWTLGNRKAGKGRKGSIAAVISKYLVLVTFAVYIGYPIFLVAISSLKNTNELYQNIYALPKAFQWKNFRDAWVIGNLGTYYKNSIIITCVSIFLIVIMSSLVAFAVSRKNFRFAKPIYLLFLAGITIPYQIGILPLYLHVSKLGLNNSLFGIILVYLAFGMPFSVFIFEGFFKTVPVEIEEAAIVDGCKNFQIYSRIILPLSPTVIATVVIFCLVWIWNDMFYPMVFLSSKDLKTIPIGLLAFKGEFISNYPTMFAGVVIASVPITIAYLLLQNQFMDGITAGAVKG